MNIHKSIFLLIGLLSISYIINTNQPPFKNIEHFSDYDILLDKERIEKFREDFLIAHNKRRADHNAAPLVRNEVLEKYAQFYTEYLVKHRNCDLTFYDSSHSPKAIFREGSPNDSEIKEKANNIFGQDYWNWAKKSYNSFGENIAYTGSTDGVLFCNGKEFTDFYYDEIVEYSRANPSGKKTFSSSIGSHFAQLVWKKSREIGVGFAICKNKNDPLYYCINTAVYYEAGLGYMKFYENVELPEKERLDEILKEIKDRSGNIIQ